MFNLDFAKLKQIGFQDPATPIMEGIIDLHNKIMFYVVAIFFFVITIIILIIKDFPTKKNQLIYNKMTHNAILETVWTIIPSVILITIAIPSFALLYSMDEIVDPFITIKVIGHQWYWSYEDPFKKLNFDSYMIATNELKLGELRLLEVDNLLELPIDVNIRILVTSTDVLHSWAVPSLGIKIDAVPGRLNQITTFIKRPGIFYGQCSELCGINHGFMPIKVRGVYLDSYL